MVKLTTAVSLDYELVAQIKEKGFKLSTVVNDLLKAHLNKLEEPEDNARKDLEELKIQLAVNQSKSGDLKKLITKREKEKHDRERKEDEKYTEVWK